MVCSDLLLLLDERLNVIYENHERFRNTIGGSFSTKIRNEIPSRGCLYFASLLFVIARGLASTSAILTAWCRCCQRICKIKGTITMHQNFPKHLLVNPLKLIAIRTDRIITWNSSELPLTYHALGPISEMKSILTKIFVKTKICGQWKRVFSWRWHPKLAGEIFSDFLFSFRQIFFLIRVMKAYSRAYVKLACRKQSQNGISQGLKKQLPHFLNSRSYFAASLSSFAGVFCFPRNNNMPGTGPGMHTPRRMWITNRIATLRIGNFIVWLHSYTHMLWLYAWH